MKETMHYVNLWNKSNTLLGKYQIQLDAAQALDEKQFDLYYDLVDFVYPPIVDMGLNTDPHDDIWEEKLAEVRKAVEENGVARASWSCTGRTRHLMHSQQLEEALPEYRFVISYDTYKCEIYKH